MACVGAVDELAREAGVDPLDWMLDYSLAHDLEPVFFMRFVHHLFASMTNSMMMFTC